MKLLQDLCTIRATSGDEEPMKDFVLDYIQTNQHSWKQQPEILSGKGFQDCIMLVFGKPRTAIFAHMDSIGFTVRYGNQLVKIGGPRTQTGYELVGSDSQGEIECTLIVDEDDDSLSYDFHRPIETGTPLSFKPNFRESDKEVQCCYMDNRLGVYAALKVAETLQDGIIVFSSWEEHGGGSVGYLAERMYRDYEVHQALISDITWITEGVTPGNGVVISIRDSGIPRRSFVNKIRNIAQESTIPFQLEVEGSGGSDGTDLQKSMLPIDWCFIGAAEQHVHTPNELVNKKDIQSMIDLYAVLMESL
jgi:putative aminopeptidase FrvX